MPRRHFIQHIGGDPIAVRFVKYDPATHGPAMRQGQNGRWEADWTEDPAERNEWENSGEAQEAKTKLGVGIVVHTQPDQPDIDIEASRKHQPEPPEIHNEEPLRDDELPWWQR